MNPLDLPASPGTYALIFLLPDPLSISAGRLGELTLPAGNVIYVGSAQGPGGLRARVGRHLRAEKRPHWHIDALTAAVPATGVWYIDSTDRLECAWSSTLASLPGISPIPGFGASDCRCPTHLYALPPCLLETAHWQLTSSFSTGL